MKLGVVTVSCVAVSAYIREEYHWMTIADQTDLRLLNKPLGIIVGARRKSDALTGNIG